MASTPLTAIGSHSWDQTGNVASSHSDLDHAWIFRMPEGTPLVKALDAFVEAANAAGADRGKIRGYLASGNTVAGVSFAPTGDVR